MVYPNIAGPRPDPPKVHVDQIDSRVARKRRQSELVAEAKTAKANPTPPSSALQKRFWKSVAVHDSDDGLQVLLDKRPVRTSALQVLLVPKHKRALAAAIALEWDTLTSAQQALKQHHIPLTALAARAIDLQNADTQLPSTSTIRDGLVSMLMRYLATDTLLCWAPEKSQSDSSHSEQSLRQKQIDVATPIISVLQTHIFPGVEFIPSLDDGSILPKSQPAMTEQVVRDWLRGLPAFELAGIERAVLATKSLLVAIRLLIEWSPRFADLNIPKQSSGTFGIAEAVAACSTEVTWQTDIWGEVEDTHDVDKEDLARQLGSVILLVS